MAMIIIVIIIMTHRYAMKIDKLLYVKHKNSSQHRITVQSTLTFINAIFIAVILIIRFLFSEMSSLAPES